LIIHCSANDEPGCAEGGMVITGFIKYSYKHLYFYSRKGKVVEKDPCCILDFYILETMQRQGIGFKLLEQVLQVEGERAATFDRCCYDRPSPKLIAFIKKNYRNTKENLQPNKFMIFDGFIDELG
jgi:alpha-tubulin N-acetyltransferase 1